MKSANRDIRLEMPELPARSAMVFEPRGLEGSGKTSVSGVTELPTHKHKRTQEENRMM